MLLSHHHRNQEPRTGTELHKEHLAERCLQFRMEVFVITMEVNDPNGPPYFGVVCDKGDEVHYHIKCQSVFGFPLGVAMSSGCQARPKKLVFKTSNRSSL